MTVSAATVSKAVVSCALGLTLVSQTVNGQELSRYRTFELKSSVAAVLTATGATASQVKTVHQRPALMQDLEWRPSRWTPGVTAASTDPVDQVLFAFYDDQLFRIVVDYSHERTTGLTDADLIDAVSTMYGMPLVASTKAGARVPPTPDAESGIVIAKWGDADHGVALYRTTSYGAAWRLIVTDRALEVVARRAKTQATKLEAIEAPQKEIDRQMQERERERVAADKARVVNKPAFKP
jgi:hypothetical protein